MDGSSSETMKEQKHKINESKIEIFKFIFKDLSMVNFL